MQDGEGQRGVMRLDTQNTPQYRAAQRLYDASFADEERAPFGDLWGESLGSQQPAHTDLWTMQLDTHVIGMVAFGTFADDNVGYLAYLAISPHAQGRGHGQWLFSRVLEEIDRVAFSERGRSPRLCFWEVRDPAEASGEQERLQRQRRIAFYERLGAQTLPITYLCPPINDGQPAVPCLLMVRTNPPGSAIDRSTAREVALIGLIKCNHATHDSDYVRLALESIDQHWPVMTVAPSRSFESKQ